ncbi:MAG: myo-inositol-1(or 4)-monophosphatase [Planctomycetota bacterium]|jgi:myo-inositol-1(or 4)-monophosphatase
MKVHDSIENPEALLELAAKAAKVSGDLLMTYFGRLQASQIKSKSTARDLVTEADVESERLLVKALREATPTFHIEAEEEVRDALTDDGTPRWFLDPLDGTVNFVHGLPAFAVSMGLFVGNVPQLAVVHLPRLGETFSALRGGGAFMNGEPISVSDVGTLGDAILATGFPYRRNELEHSNLENFNRFFYDVRGMRRMGSAAIDLAFVAAGRLDAYWELHLSPHDVAGGALLVREAGGIVTDGDGKEDWLRGGHIVAAGPGLHPAVLDRIVH